MTAEQFQLLDVRRLRGRLSVEEVEFCLGFAFHESRILISAELLLPLGNPLPTGSKHFSFAEIERLRNDAEWPANASDCVVQAWSERNKRTRKELLIRWQCILRLPRLKRITMKYNVPSRVYSEESMSDRT